MDEKKEIKGFFMLRFVGSPVGVLSACIASSVRPNFFWIDIHAGFISPVHRGNLLLAKHISTYNFPAQKMARGLEKDACVALVA